MSSPQANQEDQMPAMVLGFHDDVLESEANPYPAARLASPPVPVSVPAPAKKLDDSDNVVRVVGSDGGQPNHPTGSRDFSSGICDLQQSWMVFADAWCCSYCLASAHHNYLLNEQEGIYAPVCCGLFCVDVGLEVLSPYLPSTICFHTYFMRHLIRQRYHLHTTNAAESDENGGGEVRFNAETLMDCLTAFFCTSCAIAQHQREILRHGEWCGGVLSDRHALATPGTVHTV